MSVNELLSQDEIDALLHGVDGGEVETENELVLIDELSCEHLPFSKVKRDLNREIKFCSTKVLTEYLTNLRLD